MENVTMKEKFLSLEEELEKEQSLLQNKISSISSLRMISFLAGAALFIIGVADALLWAEILGGIFLLVFIYLVKKHSDMYQKLEITESKLEVVQNYIKRFSEEWRTFEERGKEYLTNGDTVSVDLDLLGDNSLYQMLCVAHTKLGKEKLSKTMKLDNVSINNNGMRNEAVEELMAKTGFAIEFEAAGFRLEKRKKQFNVLEFEKYCKNDKAGVLPKWAKLVSFLFPVAVINSVILWLIGVVNYALPLGLFLMALAFSWLTKTVTDRVIMPLYNVGYGTYDYLFMLELLDKEKFTSKILSTIKEDVSKETGAMSGFAKLRNIVQAYNICFNPLFHQILSGFFLWDYHLARFMEKWKKKYGNSIAKCFYNIADVEELMSLSVLGVVRDTRWGEIKEDENEVKLQFEQLYHPLINPEKVISNSADLQSGITIITGSNMSGKTTFLRTIAMNLALAYMGAPICGNSLQANYMKIFTSMRIVDDVANGISTFYAEILRIKAMAEYTEKNLPMICLIDEIFKGTNSADRIVGASEAIKKLSGDKCMTVVSTHDFELCNIEDDEGNPATNYHFEEYYSGDEIRFDYKLKNGRCTTTNAKELLRMAGFSV